jgi:hypothetical protein
MVEYGAMCNLSGGIDSTFAAYKWLKENPHRMLLIHHVILQKRSGRANRWLREWTAVQNVLEWFKSQGLTNFDLVKTEIDSLESSPVVNDMVPVSFATVLVLSAHKGVPLIVSANMDDMALKTYPKRAGRRKKLYSIYLPDLEYLYPIKFMRRSEILDEIPLELAKLCYWCQDNSAPVIPCGVCAPCRSTRLK